jgi:microcompartment protein CcmL/EutN
VATAVQRAAAGEHAELAAVRGLVAELVAAQEAAAAAAAGGGAKLSRVVHVPVADVVAHLLTHTA